MQTWQKNEDEGKRCFQGNHILILMQNHDVPDFVFAQSQNSKELARIASK